MDEFLCSRQIRCAIPNCSDIGKIGKTLKLFLKNSHYSLKLACTLIICTGFYYMFVLDWNEGMREPMANSRYTAIALKKYIFSFRWKFGDLMMGLYGGLYAVIHRVCVLFNLLRSLLVQRLGYPQLWDRRDSQTAKVI